MIEQFPERRITDSLPRRVKAVARIENDRVIVWISSSVPESQHRRLEKKVLRKLRGRMHMPLLMPAAAGARGAVAVRSGAAGAALTATAIAAAAFTAVVFSRSAVPVPGAADAAAAAGASDPLSAGPGLGVLADL